jgi:hypothetical protein
VSNIRVLVAAVALGIALLLLQMSGAPAQAETIDLAEVMSIANDTAQMCCKVCHKGKACGDTCIARDKECHLPPGCACDG